MIRSGEISIKKKTEKVDKYDKFDKNEKCERVDKIDRPDKSGRRNSFKNKERSRSVRKSDKLTNSQEIRIKQNIPSITSYQFARDLKDRSFLNYARQKINRSDILHNFPSNTKSQLKKKRPTKKSKKCKSKSNSTVEFNQDSLSHSPPNSHFTSALSLGPPKLNKSQSEGFFTLNSSTSNNQCFSDNNSTSNDELSGYNSDTLHYNHHNTLDLSNSVQNKIIFHNQYNNSNIDEMNNTINDDNDVDIHECLKFDNIEFDQSNVSDDSMGYPKFPRIDSFDSVSSKSNRNFIDIHQNQMNIMNPNDKILPISNSYNSKIEGFLNNYNLTADQIKQVIQFDHNVDLSQNNSQTIHNKMKNNIGEHIDIDDENNRNYNAHINFTNMLDLHEDINNNSEDNSEDFDARKFPNNQQSQMSQKSFSSNIDMKATTFLDIDKVYNHNTKTFAPNDSHKRTDNQRMKSKILNGKNNNHINNIQSARDMYIQSLVNPNSTNTVSPIKILDIIGLNNNNNNNNNNNINNNININNNNNNNNINNNDITDNNDNGSINNNQSIYQFTDNTSSGNNQFSVTPQTTSSCTLGTISPVMESPFFVPSAPISDMTPDGFDKSRKLSGFSDRSTLQNIVDDILDKSLDIKFKYDSLVSPDKSDSLNNFFYYIYDDGRGITNRCLIETINSILNEHDRNLSRLESLMCQIVLKLLIKPNLKQQSDLVNVNINPKKSCNCNDIKSKYQQIERDYKTINNNLMNKITENDNKYIQLNNEYQLYKNKLIQLCELINILKTKLNSINIQLSPNSSNPFDYLKLLVKNINVLFNLVGKKSKQLINTYIHHHSFIYPPNDNMVVFNGTNSSMNVNNISPTSYSILNKKYFVLLNDYNKLKEENAELNREKENIEKMKLKLGESQKKCDICLRQIELKIKELNDMNLSGDRKHRFVDLSDIKSSYSDE